MHDWKFDKVYNKPDDELEKLKQYYALLTPDFSLFTDMPLALQIESVFKNRWCGAYWQSRVYFKQLINRHPDGAILNYGN